MSVRSERGFTLPEVLIVIAVAILLLGASVFLLRPKSYEAQEADSERQLGLAAIAQGLSEYKVKHGEWPDGIPAKDTAISSVKNQYDLCPRLVPAILQGIPLDPVIGLEYTGAEAAPVPSDQPCTTPGVNYFSGYAIRKNNDQSLTLTAPGAALSNLELSIR